MNLDDKRLGRSLQLAYSAERAAAFAYIGHAGSLRDATEKTTVSQIEQDEWDHRTHVHEIMREYGIPVSKWLEVKYYVIGRIIGFSCYLIGRFMPYFFAGKLESGNVCEYFVMIRRFHALGINKHDQLLYEMGVKEKEHEDYFLNLVKDARWFPFFERFFSWGTKLSANDVDLEELKPVEKADSYCQNFSAH